MQVQQQVNCEKDTYEVVNVVLDVLVFGTGYQAVIGQLDGQNHEINQKSNLANEGKKINENTHRLEPVVTEEYLGYF